MPKIAERIEEEVGEVTSSLPPMLLLALFPAVLLHELGHLLALRLLGVRTAALRPELTGLRIDRARELLSGTDEKLSNIALQIGYNEPNYFSHVFRKAVGMTPKEYRSRSRQA